MVAIGKDVEANGNWLHITIRFTTFNKRSFDTASSPAHLNGSSQTMLTHNRPFVATFLFILNLVSLAAIGHSQSVRTWQSPANGKTFEGTFVDYKEPTKEEKQSDENGNTRLGKVTILRTKDNKQSSFDLDLFSDVDKRYVATQYFSKNDSKQFELVAGQIEALRQSNDSVIAILKALDSQYPTAPYASLWAGVALGAAKNDAEQALRMCKKSIDRIRKQRELDDSRHKRTLAAAYNNSAICYIKDLKPSSACRQFILALRCADRTPAVVAHNIRTFYDLATKGEIGGLKLEANDLKQLASAMAELPLEDPKRKFAPGFYYSLDLDVPLGSESESSVVGIVPPDSSLELISSGTGVVCAPGFVMTIRDAVTHPSRTAYLATVAIPSTDERWELKKARKVLIAEPKIKDVSGSRSSTFFESSGNGGSSATFQTDFVITNPKDGTPHAEFALLQFEDLKIAPAPLLDGNVTHGMAIELVGFERGPEMLKGTKSKNAKVLDTSNRDRWIIDQWVSGGLRGSPVIDEKYRMVGIASRTLTAQQSVDLGLKNQTTAVGECLSLNSLKEWFSTTTKTADLKFEDNDAPGADRDRIQRAIVPVFVWGRRNDNEQSNRIYSEFYYDDEIVRKLVLRDEWCFRCDGKGSLKCQICLGTGEVPNGTQTVQSGMTVQGPRFIEIPKKGPCPNCQAQKRVKCNECQGGRLRMVGDERN